MRVLFKYLRDYRKECIIGPLFKCTEAVLELIVPLVMAKIIDVGIPNGDTMYILKTGGEMIGISALGFGCAMICQYMASRASQGFGTQVRNALFKKINTFSDRELDRFGAGSLVTRITNDVNQLQVAVAMTIRLVSRAPFLIIGAVVMAMILDLKLSLVFLIAGPVVALALYLVMSRCVPLYKKIQKKLDRLATVTREELEGVRVVRAFSRQAEEKEKFDAITDDAARASEHVGRISALLNPLTFLVMNLAILAIVWFGGFRVDSGALTQGEIIAFVNYLTQISLALIVVANLVVIFTRAAASASRVSEVLSTDSSVTEKESTFTRANLSAPAVEFQDVDFSIGAENILSGIRFQIHPGEMFGIIGSTGSGKSTIANLIERFSDATGGEIRVFGHNVKDYSFNEFRSQIGLVPQNAQVFTGTVRENLTMLRSDVTEEQLIAALKTAQAYDFVMERENGLDSVIEQGGRNLSGGQRQRLTIARALVARPRLLILDDSDSALDFATQQKLRTAIRRDLEGITVIVISQRVHSVRWCDQILVLDDGEAVGLGTHGELLRENEVYREICASQLDESEVAANE